MSEPTRTRRRRSSNKTTHTGSIATTVPKRRRRSAGGTQTTGITISKRKRSDMSRQQEDTVAFGVDSIDSTQIIGTPFDLSLLSTIFEKSNILTQCVDAMVTNIALQGHRVVPISEGVEIDPEESMLLTSFITAANPTESLGAVHGKLVHQYEKYGFGFMEVVRNTKGVPSLLKHTASSGLRQTRASGNRVPVTVTINRGGSRSRVREMRTFRKYVQVKGTRKTYFKEFGDPRHMSYKTGRRETKEHKVKKEDRATELLHRRQFSEDAYGMPRWISQLPSILGSREAEEVNLRYFEDNTVPPMIMSVAGGRLTRTSYLELRELLENQGVGSERQNKILLVEAVPEVADLDGKGTVSLQIDKLTDARQSDGLFKEYDESNMGKVRSSFRLPPVVLGQSQDVTFACYDAETQTLTDQGWVYHSEWVEGMKIACYEKDDGSIQFHEPDNGLLLYDVENVCMYRVQSQQQDMYITPKHRMLSASVKEGVWRVGSIESVETRQRSYFRTSGVYDGGLSSGSGVFTVPVSNYRGGVAAQDGPVGDMPSSLFMEWLGYYLADGSMAQSGNALRIGAKKRRKVERFLSLHEELEECGFRTRESNESAGTYFTVSHKGMASWVLRHAGAGSANKKIPQMVYDYSVSDLQILFDAMMFCDGSWDAREGRSSGSYSTVSPALADSFQALAVLLGYRACLRTDRPGTFGINPIHRVMLSRRDTCQIIPTRHITRETYTGQVYCFSVPTGVFITRRRGKVAIQGNTANVSAYLSEIQVFRPERAKHDEWYNMNFVNHPHGLGLTTCKLESKGPSITSPEQIVKTMTALNVMGGVTPRSAIASANETLQLSFPQYPERGTDGWEDWMDMPITLSQRKVAGSQQTGEGDHVDTEQSAKDEDTKSLEGDGNVEPKAVEHGSE